MAEKSYPPQYTDNTLKVIGIESFCNLYAVVPANHKAKLRVGPRNLSRQRFSNRHFDQPGCKDAKAADSSFPIPEAPDIDFV
jgi:hypothetical protein